MSGKKRGDLDREDLFRSILGDLGAEPGPADNMIEIARISFNEAQPRRYFSEESLADLAASISSRGVLEPVLVRPTTNGYELIAGERRTRAAVLAGLQQIPAVVLQVDDHAALEISIMENLQREDLNSVEETDAVLSLLELSLDYDRKQVIALLQEIYNEERGRTSGAVFDDERKAAAKGLLAKLGRFTPSSFYVNRVPILDFPDELLEAVRGGRLEFTKAQVIARIKEPSKRIRLLEETLSEGLTLRQLRARAARKEQPAARTDGAEGKQLARTRRLLTARRLEKLAPQERARADLLLRELRELLEG